MYCEPHDVHLSFKACCNEVFITLDILDTGGCVIAGAVAVTTGTPVAGTGGQAQLVTGTITTVTFNTTHTVYLCRSLKIICSITFDVVKILLYFLQRGNFQDIKLLKCLAFVTTGHICQTNIIYDCATPTKWK